MYVHNTYEYIGTYRYVIGLIIIRNMIIIGRYSTYIADKLYDIHEYLHDIIKYYTRARGDRSLCYQSKNPLPMYKLFFNTIRCAYLYFQYIII